MGKGQPCANVACSFIALAAWVRQLPFRLLNSRVVTECLESGQLKMAKPLIILMVECLNSFNCRRIFGDSELKLPRIAPPYEVGAVVEAAGIGIGRVAPRSLRHPSILCHDPVSERNQAHCGLLATCAEWTPSTS
jgi:hypothetical protein